MNITLKKILRLQYMWLVLLSSTICATNGISYTLTGGRFGDNVLSYCHARWLSFVHKLDFYYRPFHYTENLYMHQVHPHIESHGKQQEVMLLDAQEINLGMSDTVYITKAYPKNNRINFDNHEFFTLLKNEIRPIQPVPQIEIPKDHVSIAVHVRRGGGWDRALCQDDTISTAGWIPGKGNKYKHEYVDQDAPLKFPPDAYYMDQLQYTINQFPNRSIYVHLFTDDPQPELIAKKYQEAINNLKVTFGFRAQDNRHDSNVLEDFFALMQFDCLIRSTSHFSLLAGILGRPKLEIYPKGFRWEGRKLIITKVVINERNKDGKWNFSKKLIDLETANR